MSHTDANAAAWRAEYPFPPHYAVVGGHRLHYVDEGSGPPVLMVHGNPTWSFLYRRLVRAVAPRMRAIAPDHLGCGLSDKPQDWPYRLAGHIANLEALVEEHLRLERFSLVVHDWGGPIGLGYAVRRPERVERLVILNTAAFFLPRCPLRIRICRWPIFGDLVVRGANGFVRAAFVMAVAKRKRLTPAARAGLLYPYDSWRNRVAILGFVRDIPLGPRHPSRGVLAGIQERLGVLAGKPALICWGTQDFCFTEAFLDAWTGYLPNAAVLRFPDAGHYLLEDAGESVVSQIAAFLDAGASGADAAGPAERHCGP